MAGLRVARLRSYAASSMKANSISRVWSGTQTHYDRAGAGSIEPQFCPGPPDPKHHGIAPWTAEHRAHFVGIQAQSTNMLRRATADARRPRTRRVAREHDTENAGRGIAIQHRRPPTARSDAH